MPAPTEIIVVKAIQTIPAWPSEWDAWNLDGRYWYLRYRSSIGTATRQPGPGWTQSKPPAIQFEQPPPADPGRITLERFCQLAGLGLHPELSVVP